MSQGIANKTIGHIKWNLDKEIQAPKRKAVQTHYESS